MKKILIAIVFFVSLTGCKYMRPNETPPSSEYVFKDSGLITGVAKTDYDRVTDVSLNKDTDLKIEASGRILNRYEYRIEQNTLIFENAVSLLPGGQLIFIVPRSPAVPKGSAYTIQFQN